MDGIPTEQQRLWDEFFSRLPIILVIAILTSLGAGGLMVLIALGVDHLLPKLIINRWIAFWFGFGFLGAIWLSIIISGTIVLFKKNQ